VVRWRRDRNDPAVKIDRAANDHGHVLGCVECLGVTTTARGWKAYRYDDPEMDEPPKLALSCPECAEREFSAWSRKV